MIVVVFLGDALLNFYFGLRQNNDKKGCTMEAKLCPDGSAVGRIGPNCEFAVCPNSINTTAAKIGSTIAIKGISITPLAVAEDSRCAADVVCVWAGTVKLRAKLENIGVAREEVLEMGKPASFAGTRVLLASVSPETRAGKTIAPDQYIFNFQVDQDNEEWQNYKGEGFEFKYPKNFGAEIWNAHEWPPKATIFSNSESYLKGCPNIPDGTLFENNPVIINGINYQLNKISDAAAGSTYTTYCYIGRKDQKNYAIQFVIRYTSGCGENCGPYCGTENEAACKNFDKVKEVEKPIEQMVSTFKTTQ